jgi:hypothetical protein
LFQQGSFAVGRKSVALPHPFKVRADEIDS